MACNESLDFLQAISHALQRLQYGPPYFQLSACTSHRLDSVSCRHRSTLYPTERLSLMLVFPGYLLFYQTMLLYGGYISHRGSTNHIEKYLLKTLISHSISYY